MNIFNWELFLEFVGHKPISNINSYTKSMTSAIDDKLFFVNKIDFDVIVDFGCADCSFLEKIHQSNKKIKLIGYDLDPDMISLGKQKLGNKGVVTDDWNLVLKSISGYKKPLLNLSSVIHEVYSYSSNHEIKNFWNEKVFGRDFKWITIRDMIPDVNINKVDINQFKDDIRKIRLNTDKKILSSFEDKWGSITNYRAFIHFLLKYRYTNNWDREVNENYLPIVLDTLKSKISNNFKIIEESNYILPFLQKRIYEDYKINIEQTTHTKMIIKNLKF